MGQKYTSKKSGIYITAGCVRFMLITRSMRFKKGEEANMENNYILPFLWMRGEEEAVLREEMEKIYEIGRAHV